MILGLIGGMSWESTAEYYRLINQAVARRLGGLHSAECLLYSVDFAPVENMQRSGDWEELGDLLVRLAVKLEAEKPERRRSAFSMNSNGISPRSSSCDEPARPPARRSRM